MVLEKDRKDRKLKFLFLQPVGLHINITLSAESHSRFFLVAQSGRIFTITQ